MPQNGKKNVKNHIEKIPKILQEKQGTQGGSNSKAAGVYSKNIRKTEKKLDKRNYPAQPTDLMDPDQANALGALD